MMEKALLRVRVLDSFWLKLIAFSAMVIDHVGAAFFPDQLWFRYVGRLAFPIFCFLLVEGYMHTRNFWKYAIRILVVALISEIPFDLALNNGNLFQWGHQNTFFTLFLGLLALLSVDSFLKIGKYIPAVVCAVVIMVLAQVLNTDYGAKGICFVLLFYFIKYIKGIWSRVFLVLAFILLNYSSNVQIFAALALIPIYFYNGKRGMNKLKYLFYAGYPVHLFIIALVKIYA